MQSAQFVRLGGGGKSNCNISLIEQHESDFLPAFNHSSSVSKNEEKWGVNRSTLKAFSSSSEKGFLVSRNLNKVWYQRQAKSSTLLRTQKKKKSHNFRGEH
jgi:hypothetical protein